MNVLKKIALSPKSTLFAKLILLAGIGVLYFGRALNDIKPYPTGDGPEYILTTEAIYNHFTPNITHADLVSFKTSYIKKNKWEDVYKTDIFQRFDEHLQYPKLKFMDECGGVYTDKKGKNYSYHFFFLSYVNTPARFITAWMGGDPLSSFQFTNAFLVTLTCFILLFLTPFDLWKTLLVTICFVFSSNYWYLGWTHPEVFTTCMITIGFWLYFQQKRYWGIFFVTLASLQNQPIAIMLAFLCLDTLIANGFNFRNIRNIFISAVLFLWPAIFYYLHFDTTNLIKDAGFLSTKYITFTRVFGFYFDLNQGVVLVIPLILLAFLFFWLRQLLRVIRKKEKATFTLLFPLFLIAMTCTVSTMGNWNHGQAIVNRYASWFSGIIIIFCFFQLKHLKPLSQTVLLLCFTATQAYTILYHQQFNKFDWSQESHRPLAKWVLDHCPSLYNPDPNIFSVRTLRNYDMSESSSPIIYISQKKDKVQKIMVHRNRVSALTDYGFSQADLQHIIPHLRFVNDWAYINPGDVDHEINTQTVKQKIHQRKIEQMVHVIRGSAAWMKQIEQKAKDWQKTPDEVILIDAEYMVGEAEKEGYY